MHRRTAALAAATAALALAATGCASSSTPSQHPATTTTGGLTYTQPASAQSAGTAFYNLTTLQNDVVRVYNTTPPLTNQANNADCVYGVAQDATCVLTLTTGDTTSQTIHISADGLNWASS